ncbi:hypothetical protein HYU16_04100 [Candidatus Woesearchaeota archaeon]|nr:hypothetical protein [Candidatus Woesearchaeota archaeon]
MQPLNLEQRLGSRLSQALAPGPGKPVQLSLHGMQNGHEGLRWRGWMLWPYPETFTQKFFAAVAALAEHEIRSGKAGLEFNDFYTLAMLAVTAEDTESFFRAEPNSSKLLDVRYYERIMAARRAIHETGLPLQDALAKIPEQGYTRPMPRLWEAFSLMAHLNMAAFNYLRHRRVEPYLRPDGLAQGSRQRKNYELVCQKGLNASNSW